MACCTGQTKCNDTVTIGYLKSFIGSNILTTAGTVVNVSTARTDWRKDAYCPTYAELTGGTLIPNFVDGGTNKWASNVDGITINHGSSYSGNQVVKVEDLILTYTRYKSIAVSASSTSLSECGGSTTLGRTFKLTKTIKAMNDCNGGVPSTSSSEGSDTASTTTYSSTQSWLTINGNTATAPKNGTVSSSTLTTEVKASVNYKGATYTSTGVTVSQAALTGAYETTGVTTPTGMDLIITPSDQKFGCKGGNYAITGTGNYYTRYKWKDSCGVVYNDVYNDVQGTDTVGPYGGMLDAVNCNNRPCDSCYTYNVNVQWSGITSAVTFTQSCQERCKECNSYDEWGSGNGTATAPCEGGSVKVTAEVSGMHYERVYISDVCRTVSSAETSMVQDINVNIPQNEGQTEKTYTGSGTTSQGGTINYTITQPGGCVGCHDPQVLYTFDDITVSCDSGAATSQTASYTKVTTYTDCPSETESGSTIVAILARECWSDPNPHVIQQGSSAPTLAAASPKIIQEGGCTCTSCTCNDLTVAQVSSLPSSGGNNATIATYTGSCLTNISATESANWLSNITAANGIVTASVSANAGNTSRSTTISISGSADGTTCTKNVTVSQDGVACTCDDLTTTSVSDISSASGTGIIVATYTAANCITNISATTNETWLVITGVTNGNVYANVSANTSTTQDRTATITVSGTAISTNCTKTATLKQLKRAEVACDCSNLVIKSGSTTVTGTLSLEFDASGTYKGNSIKFESDGNCDNGFNYSNFSITGSDITAASVNNQGVLTIRTNYNTSYSTTISSTGSILYNGVTCTTFNYTIDTQECDCDIYVTSARADYTASTYAGVTDLEVATCKVDPSKQGAYDACVNTGATNGLVVEDAYGLTYNVLRSDGINYSIEVSTSPNYGYDDVEAYIEFQTYFNGEPCNDTTRVNITIPTPNRDPNVKSSIGMGMCNSMIKFYMGDILPCGGGKIPQ
jgi:hypothetical protein